MKQRSSIYQTMLIGFTLFAALFGAGNLIFPSYMGLLSGKNLTAFILFIAFDVVLTVFGFVAEGKRPNMKMVTFSRVSLPVFYTYMYFQCITSMFGVVPRTAATTYEMGIHPLFPWIPQVAFSLVYFAVTILLALRPAKVVDIVGNLMTPILLVTLCIVIVAGIIHPLGAISDQPQQDGLFAYGVLCGYQAQDAPSAPSFAMVYMLAIMTAGFTDQKQAKGIMIRGCAFGGLLLVIIYAGLFYLGASLSTEIMLDEVTSASLMAVIVDRVLGSTGLWIFAIVVLFACLTTAITSVAGLAQMFVITTKGKLKYEWAVIMQVVLGYLASLLGVDGILTIMAPVVSITFPIYTTLYILTFFTDKIKNDNVYTFGMVGAAVFAVIDFFQIIRFPGTDLMLGWVIPTIVVIIIGFFVPSKTHRDPVHAAAAGVEVTPGFQVE